VAAHIIKHNRHLILGQLLDQPEQLIALHAHKPSVRRPSLITAEVTRGDRGLPGHPEAMPLQETGNQPGLARISDQGCIRVTRLSR
jgi:hypothetical protein